jgi:glutamate dehydrogenase (NAD(P)+)
MILEVSDPEAGLTGWLAVDSLIDDHCCGGIRMLPDVTPVELTELAKAMTWKHAFLGIPHGGAKAGILYGETASKEEKRGLLAAFGRKIRNLLEDRVYLPGADMGTTEHDIRDMLGALGLRVPKRALAGGNSGWYTGLTVVASARVACTFQGLDLARASVAIEGFGAVGSSVAQSLERLGSRVVAISTSHGALYSPEGLHVPGFLEGSRKHGSRVVDFYDRADRLHRESLLELDVDVLMPCARHHSIHMDNVSRIQARVISSGANAPVAKEAEGVLWQRGILCVPDFVANAGGVLGGTMEFAGLSQSAIAGFVETDFSRQVCLLIERARKEGVPVRQLAEAVAGERFMRMKRASENRSVGKRAFSFALRLYRNGAIPQALVGALARKYFQERIDGRV